MVSIMGCCSRPQICCLLFCARSTIWEDFSTKVWLTINRNPLFEIVRIWLETPFKGEVYLLRVDLND
jgi:hypothetical protein